MSMSLETKSELIAIRSRLAGLTPNPWMVQRDETGRSFVVINTSKDHVCKTGQVGLKVNRVNAEFIAHARDDIPRLLSIISCQEKEIAKLRDEINQLRAELGNRPAEGAKPVDVWPDRW